jgi:hypothetical protein
VDERFLSFFKDKVGHEAFEKVEQERPEELVRALSEWESVKRTFTGPDGNAEDEHCAINIPVRIQSLMSEESREKLEKEQDGFSDQVVLSQSNLQTFFDPVLREIEGLVDEMLNRCGEVKVNKILCVGGFSDSKYLLKCIRARFEGRGIQVICPADPGAIVVKGAVQYGLNPSTIATRRSRKTYGLAVRGYWDATFPDHKRSWDPYQKTWMVEDKFDKLVVRGQELAVNFEAQRTYYPPAIYSTSIRLSLYATDNEDPRIVDEVGCEHLAEVVIPLNLRQDLSINDYPITISVAFGAAEIQVVAHNTKTKEEFRLNVNYDMQTGDKQAPVKRARTPEKPSANGKKARMG